MFAIQRGESRLTQRQFNETGRDAWMTTCYIQHLLASRFISASCSDRLFKPAHYAVAPWSFRFHPFHLDTLRC